MTGQEREMLIYFDEFHQVSLFVLLATVLNYETTRCQFSLQGRGLGGPEANQENFAAYCEMKT